MHVFSAWRPAAKTATQAAQQASVLRCRRTGPHRAGTGAAAAGFDAHELVVGLWSASGSSVEGQSYSTADWERARLEMWHAGKLVRSGQPTASQWAAL